MKLSFGFRLVPYPIWKRPTPPLRSLSPSLSLSAQPNSALSLPRHSGKHSCFIDLCVFVGTSPSRILCLAVLRLLCPSCARYTTYPHPHGYHFPPAHSILPSIAISQLLHPLFPSDRSNRLAWAGRPSSIFLSACCLSLFYRQRVVHPTHFTTAYSDCPAPSLREQYRGFVNSLQPSRPTYRFAAQILVSYLETAHNCPTIACHSKPACLSPAWPLKLPIRLPHFVGRVVVSASCHHPISQTYIHTYTPFFRMLSIDCLVACSANRIILGQFLLPSCDSPNYRQPDPDSGINTTSSTRNYFII